MVVISDIGDCLFGAVDLKIHRRTEFLSPAYYTSMGFGVPASLGTQLANTSLRSLVLVGDGAFQMTGLELSTIVRLGLNPVIVVLNNHGYSTERQIMDGPFNDILNWNFSKVPELLGDGLGFVAHTVGDVPLVIFDQERKGISLRKDGTLADVVPTLLDMMELPQPEEMTGQSLIAG